jgi:hypothetical protein
LAVSKNPGCRVREPPIDLQAFLLKRPGCSDITLLEQYVSDPAHGDGALAHVAQPLVDRELFFSSDPQRLIEVAAAYQDVGDPAHGDGALARVAQPLEDWKQVFSENPQRLTCTSSMVAILGRPARCRPDRSRKRRRRLVP